MTEPNAQPTATAPAPAPEPTFEELAATLFKPDPADAPAAEASEEAVPPAAEGAEEEAAGAAAPDPKAERVASRITAAKRAEMRAAEERRALRAERERIDYEARINAQRAKDLESRETRIRLIEEDPHKAFEEFKLDPKKFLERLAEEQGNPVTALSKKYDALEQELKREREERVRLQHEAEHRAARAQSDADWQRAGHEFTEFVGTNVDKYPSLVEEYTESEAVQAAYSELNEVVGRDQHGRPVTRGQAYYAEFGEYPDNDVIAQHLDKLAKERIEARAKSGWRSRKGDESVEKPVQATNGKANSSPTARGSSPRTLTSRVASERGTAPKPWSQEAADEECIRILNSAYKP